MRITTRKPDPVLPTSLSFQGIVSETWIEAHGVPSPGAGARVDDSFAHEHANGTGPFRLVESRIPDRFVLERNPDWWGLAAAPVEAERLEWLRYDGDEARVRGFVDGEIDLIWQPPVERIDELRRLPGVRWLERVEPGLDHPVRPRQPRAEGSDVRGRNPFADRRVRQAMYQGIDIERLVRVWFGGHGAPRGMIIPPGVNGWSEELDHRLPYDPEKAKALLAEAGYPDGFSVKLTTSDPPWPIDRSVRAGLAPIGIKVEFEGVSDAEWLDRTWAGDMDMSPNLVTSASFDGARCCAIGITAPVIETRSLIIAMTKLMI